jgi:hypothetical protein
MKYAAILCALAVASVQGTSAGPTKAPDRGVELVGLSVAKPKPGDKFGRSMASGLQAGTRLHLQIRRPDVSIVDLDTEASKLETFTDEKGTDLSKADRAGWKSRSWLSWPEVSKDGHTASFGVTSKRVPAAGAKELHLKAAIVLRCGSAVKNAEVKDLALKKGSKLAAGSLTMTVKSVQDGGGWDEDTKMTLELTSRRPFTPVKKLTFLAPDGKEIKHHLQGRGSASFGGSTTYTRSYALARKVEAATVRIEYYSKVQTLTVPVDVAAGLGL